ncbi:MULTISPECIES: prepilin-type N-terminal cleavage/methylation domain-containing protein [Exiguobacterium]|uniref:type IV pilus modification PilV family protein n=1 Tax=Exiguobacterium TaxID=33986 RepID=UPI00110D9319|nr:MULTISPECIES: prepilin-type N-terminal cleavage/methylation domain-containing protein [Exiguobacterium]
MESEKGFTLVEVLVSIVLLGIIFTSFYGLLVQSAQTNTVSRTMMDLSYVAQNEFELMKAKGQETSAKTRIQIVEELGYTYRQTSLINGTVWLEFSKPIPLDNRRIVLRVENSPSALNRIIIEVFEEATIDSNTKLEGVLRWG